MNKDLKWPEKLFANESVFDRFCRMHEMTDSQANRFADWCAARFKMASYLIQFGELEQAYPKFTREEYCKEET